MSETMMFLLSIIGALVAFVITILCYFLKEVRDEMKVMNKELITLINNQTWQYNAILTLQGEVKVLDSQVNRHKKGVDLC